jgi:DNA-binding Lrp family transcriptional regulator
LHVTAIRTENNTIVSPQQRKGLGWGKVLCFIQTRQLLLYFFCSRSLPYQAFHFDLEQDIYILGNQEFGRVLLMIEAFVLIRVQPARLEESSNRMQTIKDEVRKVSSVKDIKGVLGRYDFVAIVETEGSQELGTLVADTLRKIKGVAETETLVVGF